MHSWLRAFVVTLTSHSNVTFIGILIRHWMERVTKLLVVAFTFALMSREPERRWSVRKL